MLDTLDDLDHRKSAINDRLAEIEAGDDDSPQRDSVEGPGEASSSASEASGGRPQEEAFPDIHALSKNDLETELKQIKKDAKTRRANIMERLTAARAALDPDTCRSLVLAATRDELADHISRYVAENRRDLIAALENWWDKYRTTLRDIEAERDDAREQLEGFLEELGYV